MSLSQIESLYSRPLRELVSQAHSQHEKYFKAHLMQASQLLSIKTGACPEDCAYCSQSAWRKTQITKQKLLDVETVVKKAKEAKKRGASRFCMGAGWREVKEGTSFDRVLKMVKEINKLGLEVCCSLGMLSLKQAKRLKEAGLYAYNHNIDTSPEFYPKIISTRSYQDRLNTLDNVRKAGLTVCTGGILGMGESHKDRISFIHQLSKLSPPPESVTVNKLVPIKGTPLEKQKPVSAMEVIRVIALCRILMPKSMIRLSAGRASLTPAEQFFCFYSGANSIFIGEKLLTTSNPSLDQDQKMLKNMDLQLKKQEEQMEL